MNDLGPEYEVKTRTSFPLISMGLFSWLGKLFGNPELEAEGTGEKIAGKVQEKIGQIGKVLGK